MTIFQIKMIAIITMVVDHIGLFFFPNLLILRIIGRLAFPLFAWLIANGARHTRNIDKYLIRLLALAAASQIPFSFANLWTSSPVWFFNAVFTLLLGLLAIKFIQKTSDKKLWVLITLTCSLVAFSFNTDYGIEGVISVVLFYIFSNDKKMMMMMISQATLFCTYLIIQIVIRYFLTFSLPSNAIFYIEPFGLASLIFIYFYNGKLGRKEKYLFYLFYPLQYIFISILLIAR